MTALRSRLQRFGHRLGVHMARHSVRNDHRLRRSLMLRHLGVDVIFDVGANVGQYGRELRQGGYRGRIVSFEPQSAPFAELRRTAEADPAWTAVNTGLAASRGSAEINVAALDGSSSLLDSTERRVQLAPDRAFVGTETVELLTLDEAAAEHAREGERPGIKLDVQGYELEVLAGGDETLRRAVFVECEVMLESLYVGQAPADELFARLYGAGLRLAGTVHGNIDRRTGMVVWMDAVFARDPA